MKPEGRLDFLLGNNQEAARGYQKNTRAVVTLVPRPSRCQFPQFEIERSAVNFSSALSHAHGPDRSPAHAL